MRHVGNYPGVTVEFYAGYSKFGTEKEKVKIIDLPGTYSLTAYSQEEVVARDFIIKEKPDVVIDVVDAGNLERNLYLTTQFIELGIPIVIALNMVDIAEKKGHKIDAKKLGELLGIKVIPTVAHQKQGMEKLKEACLETVKNNITPKPIAYSHELNDALQLLENEIRESLDFCEDYPPRWLAVKLLENDDDILQKLNRSKDSEKIWNAVNKAKKRISDHSAEDSTVCVVEARYGFVSGAVKESSEITQTLKRMFSDRIDAVVCNRLLGPLVLGLIVFGLFFFVFKLADEVAWIPMLNGEWVTPVGLFENFFELLARLSEKYISNPLLLSLVKDGIISGVGGVMGFVPLIFFMFSFIAFLEDSGYIARVAFILDRALRSFGLQGKSVLAMIISGGLGAGGCAVPGVLATRTLREEKDRLVTILVTPLMNCGAKMPVYAMLIAAFFAHSRGSVMFLLWLISWCTALISAWILRRWVVKGEQTPFVMELPIYHLPTFKGVIIHTWSRTWMYIKKAGTVILAVSVILWIMMYFPRLPEKRLEYYKAKIEDFSEKEQAAGIKNNQSGDAASKSNGRSSAKIKLELENEAAKEQLQYSIAGRIGKALLPASRLAGFDWHDNIALIGGFAAKEIVLGTLGTAYSMGKITHGENKSLSEKLAEDPDWSPLRAFALMIFVMIYAPCFATIAVIRKETGSWKWAVFSTVYTTILGFTLATLIYQIGSLFAD